MSSSGQANKRRFNVLNLNLRPQQSGGVAFPSMTKPEAIGYFSVNAMREYQDDAAQLGYINIPSQLPLDLNAGIENVLRKVPEPKFHDLLMICHYIYNHQQILRPTASGALQLDADFVTCRGILRLIMCTPYEKQKDFCLMATRLNGTIYISKLESDMQREERETMTPFQINMCSWGFKFEQYCLSDKPNVPPKTDVPVNESEEFNCLFRSKFVSHRLLYAAEMDGIKSDVCVDLNDPHVLSNLEFVELKTAAANLNAKQQRSFNFFKSLNWWAQSFLVGVSTILAGLRESDGMVREIKQFNVRDLAKNKPWSAGVTGEFLDAFLTELKSLMAHVDDPYAVVRLDYKPRQDCIAYTVERGPNVEQILPDWYRQLLMGSAPQS